LRLCMFFIRRGDRPQFFDAAPVRQRVKTNRIEVVYGSTQTAFHGAKKFGGCKLSAHLIMVGFCRAE
jgi:hypothetical protein